MCDLKRTLDATVVHSLFRTTMNFNRCAPYLGPLCSGNALRNRKDSLASFSHCIISAGCSVPLRGSHLLTKRPIVLFNSPETGLLFAYCPRDRKSFGGAQKAD